MLLRRPLHWRWFRFVRDAEEYRRYMIASYSNLSSVAAGWDLRVVVVERVANRHFQERDVAAMLRAHFSPFASDAPTASNGSPPHLFTVSVHLIRMEALTFLQQVELLAGTSVLIAAHGAALALIPFLRPSAWVLELFPVNFGYWLYEELAATSGVHYLSLHGKRVGRECRSKRACREYSAHFRMGYNETHGGATEPMASGSARVSRLYEELRSWNGFGKCKNCDVMWCSEDRGDGHEKACMTEALLPFVRSALRNVMRDCIREAAGGSSSELVVSTTWWLDRRS